MTAPNPYDVLDPVREKSLNPWQPERDALRLAVLGKLLEELSEAGAIVARCVIQGVDESEPVTEEPNRNALQNELADVGATIEMAVTLFTLDTASMRLRADHKKAHLTRWHALLSPATREAPASGSVSGVSEGEQTEKASVSATTATADSRSEPPQGGTEP